MNVPCVECEGWEGDDLLGTFAMRGEDAGMRVLLFTGDKDAYQLVTDRVSVVSTKKGITDIVVYDPAAVEARLGVRPDQVPDYLGLKGDTSDNIPGVPGIGDKTARELLQRFGCLERLLDRVDEISKPKLRETLRTHTEQARLSKRLATVRRDLPVSCALADLVRREPDASLLLPFFRELEFTRLVRQFEQPTLGITDHDQ
jgi:DNA polymerase-1